MSKERVETQRLADIKALLDYVKKGIDDIFNNEKAEQLDSMGQSTLTVLTTLRDIQEGIDRSEERLLEMHSEITNETFKNLEEPLKELLKDIEDNANDQNNFLNDVISSYQKYEDSISSMENTFKDSAKKEEESFKELNKKIEDISNGVGSIEEQIPKEVTYQASLKEINNSINRMVESERLNNDRHRETLDQVSGELTKVQELLKETNGTLDYISEIYERSTGRLSVLDLKLDTLTDILSENGKEEVIGGMDDE